MENATKALLIAAAVLIAIVLIALGVNLLNSSGNAADQAGDVSEELNSTTDQAIQDIQGSLSQLY